MERIVSIARSKATDTFIVHPMGTFRGYGGFVGINPYRELPKEVSPEIVGETVIDLLTQSGSTGFHIKNIEVYRADTADEETVRIREQFFANRSEEHTSE